MGFQFSRNGTYLRLLPRNAASREEKRHISTVPIKLISAQNYLKKKHIDTEFAAASLEYLQNFTFFSPNEVPITAASNQTPVLTHMQYRVSLPDYDTVLSFEKPSKVTYSGLTFVSIWSCNHSSSTTKTHVDDLKQMFELESFKSLVHTNTGPIKPEVIISASGAPDENPRSGEVIFYASIFETII